MKRIVLASMFCALCFAACKKKQPEVIPQPKAAGGETSAVSTATAAEQRPLTAPGSYLKTTVGQIEKAKAAKALFEKTAKQEAASLDLNNTGGN